MNGSGRVNVGHLLRHPAIRARVVERAERVAAAARAGARIRTGDNAASITVTVNDNGGVRGDRVEATVSTSSGHGAAVEYGNSKTPRGDFNLRRALMSNG